MIGHVIRWRMSTECRDDGWAGGKGRSRFWEIVRGAAVLHLRKLHRQKGQHRDGSRSRDDVSVRQQKVPYERK